MQLPKDEQIIGVWSCDLCNRFLFFESKISNYLNSPTIGVSVNIFNVGAGITIVSRAVLFDELNTSIQYSPTPIFSNTFVVSSVDNR